MNGPVHIYGLNAHGIAACRLALAQGLAVSASDLKTDADFAARVRGLLPGVDLSFGHHPPDRLEAADHVVVSPGVVQDARMWRRVRETPGWISSADFAWLVQRWDLPRIVVTGTYGKTTFCRLLLAALERRGCRGQVGGNYHDPVCAMQPEAGCTHLVFELDYQQLIATRHFQADAAVILNIHPDEHVLGDDALYRQTKLLAAQLVADPDRCLAPPHHHNLETPWLDGTVAALLDGLLRKLGLHGLAEADLEYLATRSPAGRQSLIRLNHRLSLINDGAAKGPGALAHLLPRLRSLPNPVLITHLPVPEREGITVLRPRDAGAQALEEAVARAGECCGQEESVVAYCPAISHWGRGLDSINHRIALFEKLGRRLLG